MKTSTEIDQLATALAAAQGEMPAAALNSVNPHFKSKYADLAAIREATLPSLSKHGLCIIQVPTLTADGALSLFSRIIHKSGQWIECEYPISLGTPQVMGSQITYARRYSWSALTGTAADEDDDANAAQAAAKRGVTEEALDGPVPTLPKAKSRAIYDELVIEMRALSDREALRKWWIESGPRRRTMHPDFQRWLLKDAENHETTIEVGVDEEGKTVGEQIGDEIPEEGAA